MHPHGIDIGAVQNRLVGGRVIGLDPVDQLVLTQIFGTGLGGVAKRQAERFRQDNKRGGRFEVWIANRIGGCEAGPFRGQ
jgi:hypothetical protein